MLFHKSGPQVGQPRGFAFVTYKSVNESITALEKLSGKLIGNKQVVVRLAKNINYDELEKPKPKVDIPVLAAGSSKDKRISRKITIQAIEAKLKLLESRKDDDFEINKIRTNEVPLIQKYQFNKSNEYGNSSGNNICNKYQSNSRHNYTKTQHTSGSGPYTKSSQKYRR